MIKAVFFDIDDTLFHFSKASSTAMVEVEKYVSGQLWISPETLRDAIIQAETEIGTRLGYDSAAFHNRQIRFQTAMEILRQPIYPYATEMYHIYWNTVLAFAKPEPGLVALLKILKQKQIFLGIGSDMTSYIQNKKLEKMQLAYYFQAVVTSEEAGIDKPGLPLFELCAKKAKCDPEECLFIGDNPEKDIEGAIRAGMRFVCYSKYSGAENIDRKYCIDSYENCIRGNELVMGGLRIESSKGELK